MPHTGLGKAHNAVQCLCQTNMARKTMARWRSMKSCSGRQQCDWCLRPNHLRPHNTLHALIARIWINNFTQNLILKCLLVTLYHFPMGIRRRLKVQAHGTNWRLFLLRYFRNVSDHINPLLVVHQSIDSMICVLRRR